MLNGLCEEKLYTVECTVFTFTWLEPATSLQAVNENEGIYSLTITGSVPGDGAAYRLVLGNERGEVQSGAVAHVKTKKAEPVGAPAMFVTPLEDVELPEGDTLTLKCKISGEPVPKVTW